MTRTGRPPRTTTGRRLWHWTDLAARYATHALPAFAVLVTALTA